MAANPEDETALKAAQDILARDKEDDRPFPFVTAFADLHSLGSLFNIEALVFKTILQVAQLPEMANYFTGERAVTNMDYLAEYSESLSKEVWHKIARAIIETEIRIATIDDPMEWLARGAIPVSLSFSYREMQLIGQKVLDDSQRAIDSNNYYPAVKDAKAFLMVNKAFVRAGGKDNSRLRGDLENIVNQWWNQDVNILTGEPELWNPNYFDE